MPESSPLSSNSFTTASPARCFYASKGRPYSHLRDLTIPPELEFYVDVLTNIADALGIDDLSFSSFSTIIDGLDAEELAIARSLLRTRHVEDELMQHLVSTQHEDQTMDKWMRILHAASDTNEFVPALERKKATLTAKAKEYQKELDDLMNDMPQMPSVSVTDLATLRKQIKKTDKVLKEKRARVEAFQGLPPNIDLALHALQEARDKQMELIQLRERLLGKMVDGVS